MYKKNESSKTLNIIYYIYLKTMKKIYKYFIIPNKTCKFLTYKSEKGFEPLHLDIKKYIITC